MANKKLIPEKEQREQAKEAGYAIGEEYRRRLIAWLKKVFGFGR
tara:strand:+ start:700 stop:831 length:132 start_codon:yes stop_codon:yes gene_type:complete